MTAYKDPNLCKYNPHLEMYNKKNSLESETSTFYNLMRNDKNQREKKSMKFHPQVEF